MRFANFIIALGSIAAVAGELQEINDRNAVDGSAYDSAGNQVARGISSTDSFVQELDSRATKKGTTKDTTTDTKKGTTTDTKKGTTKDTKKGKPKGCKRSSRLMPRVLNPKQNDKVGNKFVLYENEWVNCLKAKAGDDIEVTDVSGCSPVFIWNQKNIPSVFHIFCGAQSAGQGTPGDAAAAAKIAGDTDCAPVHITIAADSQDRYNAIRSTLQTTFRDRGDADLQDTDFTPMVYNIKELGTDNDKRFKFSATAGTRHVEKTTIPQSECSRQNNS